MLRLSSIIAIVMFSLSAFAAQPGKTFPFTQAQNQDGAKYVWFIFSVSGFPYEYIPAKDFPQSNRFRVVTDPRSNDIAWWPGFVALVKTESGRHTTYFTAEDERDLEDIESLYGKPRFYRFQVFEPAPNPALKRDALKRAP